MQITPYMRAHRNFRGCRVYHPFREFVSRWREGERPDGLDDDESTLGVYENTPDSAERCVVITDRGLHIKEVDGWVFLPYEAMTSSELALGRQGEKLPVENVTVRLRDGRTVPVLGYDPSTGTKDVYLMSEFLGPVIYDQERQPVTSGESRDAVNSWSG